MTFTDWQETVRSLLDSPREQLPPEAKKWYDDGKSPLDFVIYLETEGNV
jgi:hypothetical protein